MNGFSRRAFIKAGAFGIAGASLGFARAWGQSASGGVQFGAFQLNLNSATAEIYAGWQTNCYRFFATSKGIPVTTYTNSYIGPTLRFRKNQWVQATVRNNLPENTVIHWHGLHLPEASDGLPTQLIGPGSTYTRTFQIINRAGTYWYHPHPHMATATQVFKGLAGVIIVEDSEEQAIPLPRGEYDMPLVIQDRRFDVNYQYIYNSGGSNGNLGNVICVNGRPNYTLSAATRIYRFRVVNGSNARIYKLAWSNSVPMVLIGTDGGLISAPVTKPYIMLAPGERVEIWADFSGLSVGSTFKLRSLAYSGVGQNGGQSPGHGTAMDLMTVSIDRTSAETLSLPATLTPITWENEANAVNRLNPRHFPISFTSEGWVINGQTYAPNVLASNETVKLNDLEVWEFSHILNSMSLSAHPIHIHGAQFQVIGRTIEPARQTAYETVRYGHTDEGWKDTFLVMPGETVKLLIRFTRYTGKFVYHCHNLEHEDMGMMRNFEIIP